MQLSEGATAEEMGMKSAGAGVRTAEPCSLYALLQDYYYLSVKALYTVGYSTSLVTLTTAMVILCRFR